MTEHGIITRGNLPHWYVPGAAHFVTYRLAGTIPADVAESLRAQKETLLRKPVAAGMSPSTNRRLVHKQLFVDYDRYLDHHLHVDWLARPAVAALIRSSLYYHDSTKYHLLAYCVLPNHVHVLLQPIVDEASLLRRGKGGRSKDASSTIDYLEPCGEEPDIQSPLSSIMHSLKSYTANKANVLLGRKGQFWQHESYDHWVRDEDELERIVAYIIENPVKAGLVKQPLEWLFSTAHDRFLRDGTLSGLLVP